MPLMILRLAAGARPRTIAISSMASYGGFAPVRRGAMCRKSTGNGTQFTDASGAGAPAVCGRVWPPLSPRRWPRAGITRSTALRFAPVSRQRAEKGIHQRALGRSRGGFTSKIHGLGDARGRPIAFDLTSGEAADCKSYDTLIDLPERAPGALVADKAYDTDAIRDDLTQRGIRAVIPPR